MVGLLRAGFETGGGREAVLLGRGISDMGTVEEDRVGFTAFEALCSRIFLLFSAGALELVFTICLFISVGIVFLGVVFVEGGGSCTANHQLSKEYRVGKAFQKST